MWRGNTNNGRVKTLEGDLLIKELSSLHKRTKFNYNVRGNFHDFVGTGRLREQALEG
jgi:hypothetical protein